MRVDYVPLLQIQRDLLRIPIGRPRFDRYLHTIFDVETHGFELIPLVAMNPMSKPHVADLLDAYLELDADRQAAEGIADALAKVSDRDILFKAGLVIVDDFAGGWTNRYAVEFESRFGADRLRAGFPTPPPEIALPKWSKFLWITGILWSSEPASAERVRETLTLATLRMAYTFEHGQAVSLRDMMLQEGWVLATAGCPGPTLDADDLDYSRQVIEPFLDSTDMRTAVECLFGDKASRTLGFSARGLSDWAGIAVARDEALQTGQ